MARREGRKDEGAHEGIRLQKVLAQAGISSRRQAEELIRAGRVTVNGRAATLGIRVDPVHDAVELDGRRIAIDPTRRYYAFNKPAGVVTTSRDPHGRPNVIDLLGLEERVFTVGRLDAATEGLLIVTNDGELTHRLTHPSFGVPKTYVAEVPGRVQRRTIRRLLEDGVRIGPGRPARAAAVRVLSEAGGREPRTVLELTVHEGRKHVVRKMLAEAGHPALRLVRTSVGPVGIGKLAPGTYRKLTPREVRSLYEAARL